MKPNLINIAMEWHGGQTSALYRLLSTWRFHGMEHMVEAQDEINNCIRDMKRGPTKYNPAELKRLQAAYDYLAVKIANKDYDVD